MGINRNQKLIWEFFIYPNPKAKLHQNRTEIIPFRIGYYKENIAKEKAYKKELFI